MPLPLESRFKTVPIGLDEAAKLNMTKTTVRVFAIVATPQWRVRASTETIRRARASARRTKKDHRLESRHPDATTKRAVFY
jgi:hypothetical protein